MPLLNVRAINDRQATINKRSDSPFIKSSELAMSEQGNGAPNAFRILPISGEVGLCNEGVYLTVIAPGNQKTIRRIVTGNAWGLTDALHYMDADCKLKRLPAVTFGQYFLELMRTKSENNPAIRAVLSNKDVCAESLQTYLPVILTQGSDSVDYSAVTSEGSRSRVGLMDLPDSRYAIVLGMVNDTNAKTNYFTWGKGKGLCVSKQKTGSEAKNVKYSFGISADDREDIPQHFYAALEDVARKMYGSIISDDELIPMLASIFDLSKSEINKIYAQFVALPNAIRQHIGFGEPKIAYNDWDEVIAYLNTVTANFIADGIAEDLPAVLEVAATPAPAARSGRAAVAAPAPAPELADDVQEDERSEFEAPAPAPVVTARKPFVVPSATPAPAPGITPEAPVAATRPTRKSTADLVAESTR